MDKTLSELNEQIRGIQARLRKKDYESERGRNLIVLGLELAKKEKADILARVHSFVDTVHAARFDGEPWLSISQENAVAAADFIQDRFEASAAGGRAPKAGKGVGRKIVKKSKKAKATRERVRQFRERQKGVSNG